MYDNYVSYFQRYCRQTPYPHAAGDGSDGGSAIPSAAIAGGVVAGLVAILIISVGIIIAILTVLCCKRRKPLGRCCVLAIAYEILAR